ncbi:ferritin-like domain-containing protein [Lyngbya confervoides]|uniref:Ferritin-like domain-containing protein n=1 Tax=Lyngbya confervoides BDU141951 TaxID=1574623 RepID=A0ABD4T566_9CYAN|nr:ferritin-like domain-containing protein [Lyngbya confervoides]MCM1983659.1 ferritin-like domain-containing protein [Lyngbya confervoides BDU141951]
MTYPIFNPTNITRSLSRRQIVLGGALAGLFSALGLSGRLTSSASATSPSAAANDATILNKALYYEHQAIWAYSFAASRLSDTEVGRAVKALALRNQADHRAHRDALAKTVQGLGAMPVTADSSYDVSSYLQKGEGNLDSDVNIAKLALALEVDAAIAYTQEISQLKTPALVTVGASIGADEAAHATAIRSAFVAFPWFPLPLLAQQLD